MVDIGRQNRLGLYDLDPPKPEVPVEIEFPVDAGDVVGVDTPGSGGYGG